MDSKSIKQREVCHLLGLRLAEWSWRRHLLESDTDCDLDELVEFDRVGRCC